MKRIFLLIAIFLPLLAGAQVKLAEPVANAFSTKIGEHYQLPNDTVSDYIATAMTRAGTGGLDIDTTMMNLKKDPAALDNALKYLYQYSSVNRQQLIANLRNLGFSTNDAFALATYTEKKFKNDSKNILEDKRPYERSGNRPADVAAQAARDAAAVKAAEEARAKAALAAAQPIITKDSAGNTITVAPPPPPPPAPVYNMDARNLFKLHDPKSLYDLYGKENIVIRNTTDVAGNDIGQAYFLFPDTNNELEFIMHADSTNVITFSQENSGWKFPFGIKVGDPLEKVVKLNGRNFRIFGFEWEDGGTVESWEGGTLEGKGVEVLFKVVNSGDPKLYDAVTGNKKVSADNAALKKMGVVVERVSFQSIP
ncbi:hypothetical protein DCM91_19970 [Chitinophaga costaii]|nr:hypothetical protein [Chitinophaga costaii]PUZ19972.1 hypothetical protein DCM91_19970 [Chitinophaga costaii]